MTFLPLIERELRLRARSPAAYWTRFIVALGGALICLPQLLSSSGSFGTPATIGRGVFNGIVSAAFLLICGVCLLTANALSAEQREGTLGLLLLTRVRVLDVLLGKLGAMGITSVCVLVAFLPMLMLPVLAGGVSGGEAFRKGLGLLSILFFALASGLYASASQRERFKAARLALLVVGVVALAPFLLGLILGRAGPSARPVVASLPSPLGLLISAGDLAYTASAAPYWISMASLSVLSCLLLAGACVRLGRAMRGEGDASATSEQAPSSPADGIVRPRRCHPFAGEASPVAWRVIHQRGLKATVWAAALAGLLYYGCFAFLVRFSGPSSIAAVSWSFGLASAAVIGSLFAWAASRFFVESRRTGELELLLTTPVGARTVVSDQWAVLKRLIRWPLVVMLAPMFVQGFFVIMWRINPLGLWNVNYGVSVVLSAVNTVLGLVALCWLALWFGLRAGGQARAILWSVAVARALPYVISIFYSVLHTMLFTPRSGPPLRLYIMASWLPLVLTGLFYLGVIRWVRQRLLGDLAAAQATRFDLRQTVSAASQDAVSAFRKARHWTPS